MIKKFFLCIILLFVFSLLLFSETIKIGYFYLETFTIENPGQTKPKGASVEYWDKYIAPKMKVDVEWMGPLPIPRLYQYLDTGEVDAIFVIVKNPDREKKYLFATKPFATATACVYFLKSHPLNKITKVDDLFDMTIGFVEGSVPNPFMKNEKIKIENAQGEGYKKMNFDKLLAKRLDGIYDHNPYTLQYEASKLGISNKIKSLPLPIDPTIFYTAFPKTERGEMFLKMYDAANEKFDMKTFEGLLKKYTK